MAASGQDDRSTVPADDTRVDEEPRARGDRDMKVERALELIEDLVQRRALGDASAVGMKGVRAVAGDK